MREGHRIILVREWDAQVTGSGCCGRLGGENHELGDRETFRENRREMEAMGRVYRALRARLSDRDDVEITVVDPRNGVWLVPAVLRDGRRRGLRSGEIWAQIRRAVSYNAVVLDGLVLYSGRVPDPREATERIVGEILRLEAARAS